MAFIPDDALDRYDELTPAAQLGYSFVCRHRNHQTGCSPKTLDECAVKYKWSRATKFNVQKELLAGWIEKCSGGIRPLVGDFSPVDKSKKLDSASERSNFLDSNGLIFWTILSKILDSLIYKELPANNQPEEDTHIARTKKSPVEVYQQFYPNQHLSIFQVEMIETRIRDGDIWRKALEFWKGNNNVAKNVLNICNKYDELIEEKSKNGSKSQNGVSQNGNGTPAESADAVPAHLKGVSIADFQKRKDAATNAA